MRGRGAQVADLALLIIAATEGLKPQTKESIEILKETNTPFIVVLTKSDLPTKNTDRVKQELLKEEITLEEYGGTTPVIEVSAKSNHNIKELIDLILLAFDMRQQPEAENQVSKTGELKAIVIESKLDPKSGPKATIVVKNGTVRLKDELQTEGIVGKVKALINDRGLPLQEVSVGDAAEILGFDSVPTVGSIIVHKTNALSLVQPQVLVKPLKRELVLQVKEAEVGLSVIIVSDTQGSLEAIIHALPKKINIILQKTGEVSEADIMLAKSTGSIVLSFNTRIKPEVSKFAMLEKVLLRNYTIIYEMLDEVKDALEGKLQSQMEQIFGRAKVLAKFPYEKTMAFGIQVNEGRMAKNDHIRVMRDKELVGETGVSSLRVGKNPISKVEKGHEAGILITSPLDIHVGDVIISHS